MHVVVVEAAAVVGDGQAQVARRVGQRQVGAGGAGVADDVGQGFLRDAKQRGGVGLGQLDGPPGGMQAHGQRRGAVRAGNGEFAAQVLERRGQAQVVQQGGAQVVRNAPDFAHGGVQPVQRAAERGVDVRQRPGVGGQRLAQPFAGGFQR
ncbi:hypothetical protein D9M68_533690 [compost metagenome]